MAFGGELTSIRRMRRYRWTRYWYRDVRRLDRVLPLASEHARSRPEVDLRLVWVLDAKWDDPLVQPRCAGPRRLPRQGSRTCSDVKRGVAGEFAGAGHRNREQHESDVGRAADLRRVGLEIVEVVGRDFRSRERILDRMVLAAERATGLERRFRLAPPPPSLDSYLDRRDGDRSRRDEESG